MASIGDTVLTVEVDPLVRKVEVLSKAGREGVYLRTWGEHDNLMSRTDFTADEALALAQALIHAATTSVRFNAGSRIG